MPNTLLPIRHPNRDFFVADVLDAIPKDDLGSMEHPIFSLSKNPDTKLREYEHNGNTLVIAPSVLGMATIWDKDVLIYCISQLIAGINQGRDPHPTLHITAYDLLVATNRHTGGSDYEALQRAFERLKGTQIITNIKTDGKRSRAGFGLIGDWEIIEYDDKERMSAISVPLSPWLFRAVLGKEVLTINRDYFRLRGGLERRLYELSRKHCGAQSFWRIGLGLLHTKAGSRVPLKSFRHMIKRIVTVDHLPDYTLKYDEVGDQLTVFNRTGSKAALALLKDLTG